MDELEQGSAVLDSHILSSALHKAPSPLIAGKYSSVHGFPSLRGLSC